MADYPPVTQVIGSEIVAEDGTTLDRAESGKPRLRTLFANVQLIAQLKHDCDGPDKNAIWAHYLAHRVAQFSMTFQGDGTVYTCVYAGAPRRVNVPGTDRWNVETNLVVVG